LRPPCRNLIPFPPSSFSPLFLFPGTDTAGRERHWDSGKWPKSRPRPVFRPPPLFLLPFSFFFTSPPCYDKISDHSDYVRACSSPPPSLLFPFFFLELQRKRRESFYFILGYFKFLSTPLSLSFLFCPPLPFLSFLQLVKVIYLGT